MNDMIDSKSAGVTVYRMEAYGYRRFGDARMFERDEVRMVGDTYVAVLCTFRHSEEEGPQRVFEYVLPTEYRTVPEAVRTLLKQRVEYLRAQAEDRAAAIECARAAMLETGMV